MNSIKEFTFPPGESSHKQTIIKIISHTLRNSTSHTAFIAATYCKHHPPPEYFIIFTEGLFQIQETSFLHKQQENKEKNSNYGNSQSDQISILP